MPRRETAWAGRPVMSRPLNRMRPRRRRQHAGQQVEERGLARPVGPDDRAQLAGPDLEIHPVDRGEAPEGLAEPPALEQATVGGAAAGARLREPLGLRRPDLGRVGRRWTPAGEQPGERAHDPVGQEEDDQHERPPDEDLPVLEVLAQEVAHPDEDAGADERAEQGAGPAEQGHDEDRARHLPVDVLDRHELQHDGEEGPGQPREEPRDREGREPHPARVETARRRAGLVGLDRTHHPPEGRAQQVADRQHREEDRGRDHVVAGDRPLGQPPAQRLAQVEDRQVARARRCHRSPAST